MFTTQFIQAFTLLILLINNETINRRKKKIVCSLFFQSTKKLYSREKKIKKHITHYGI